MNKGAKVVATCRVEKSGGDSNVQGGKGWGPSSPAAPQDDEWGSPSLPRHPEESSFRRRICERTNE